MLEEILIWQKYFFANEGFKETLTTEEINWQYKIR